MVGFGGLTKQYHVDVDPYRLRGFNVSLAPLQSAIANANQNVGGQRLTLGEQSFDVRGVGLIRSVRDIRADHYCRAKRRAVSGARRGRGSVSIQDGLLVVTYARQLRTRGESAASAARLAAQRRLRPVLMSTWVAMLGLLPAAVSRSIGSETQKPLAIVVIGGALALVILPRLLQPALLSLAYRNPAPPPRLGEA